MKKHSTNNQLTRSRYRGLMVSVTLFILIILSLVGLNFYSSSRLAYDTQKLNAVARMRSSIQMITRDLFDMKLSWGVDPHSPHIQSVLNRLTENNQKFNQDLSAFAFGGKIANSHNQIINITPPTSKKDLAIIRDTHNIWTGLNKQITAYLKTAQDITVDSTQLDAAISSAQSASNIIYSNMNVLSTNIEKELRIESDHLKIIQYIVVSISFLYFILFIFFFVRRLRKTDRQIDEIRRETDEIMSTVNEGLFLLDSELRIGHQYSKHLESIIGQRDIGNKILSDVLEQMVSDKNLQTTKNFIKQLFNPKIKATLIKDLNPLSRIKVNVDDFNGYYATRYLDFVFTRVYEDKNIVRILVTVNDITSAVLLEERLQAEREQNDQQIEMLSVILNTDYSLLDSFVGTVKACTQKVNAILRSPGTRLPELQTKIQQIYREIHSMKGEASTLNLHTFVVSANIFEDKLKELQRNPNLSGNDFLSLTVMLNELLTLTSTIDKLIQRLTGNNNTTKSISTNTNQKTAPKTVIQDYFTKFVNDAAKRNRKQIKLSCQGVDSGIIPNQQFSQLKEIIIQLIRNSVVHGIESPSLRKQKGKSEVGEIQLSLSKIDNKTAQLVITDDGNGINFDAIRRKAIESGKYNPAAVRAWDSKQLFAFMMQSGVSTASGVGEDAGRGVGMDVVKDRVNQLGGSLKAASVANKYTRFTITFPINQ